MTGCWCTARVWATGPGHHRELLREPRPHRPPRPGPRHGRPGWHTALPHRLALTGATFRPAAAAFLQGVDGTARPLADLVLVEEGQDLAPSHWRLLRAIAAGGPDDLLIAEDSRQRIYSPRTVLGRYGIRIVGRSQRLTLNYRTTAQNLGYAMILDGAEIVDLENSRSPPATARPGPNRHHTSSQSTHSPTSSTRSLSSWRNGRGPAPRPERSPSSSTTGSRASEWSTD